MRKPRVLALTLTWSTAVRSSHTAPLSAHGGYSSSHGMPIPSSGPVHSSWNAFAAHFTSRDHRAWSSIHNTVCDRGLLHNIHFHTSHHTTNMQHELPTEDCASPHNADGPAYTGRPAADHLRILASRV
jgi:hypothetical protein